MKLQEVLKGKVELSEQQSLFKEQVEAKGKSALKHYGVYKPELQYDYLYTHLKRRAMTISKAYLIAVKIWLALNHPRLEPIDFYEGSVLKEEYKEGKKLELGHFTQLEKIYKEFVESLNDKNLKMTVREIANKAVSLAWIEAYFESGFFPQDLTVLSVNQPTHTELTDEVEHILLPTLDFLEEEGFLEPNISIELYPKAVVEEVGVEVIPDLVQEDTILYFKTTGNFEVKKLIDEVTKMEGSKVLFETSNKKFYDAFTYFVRFNTIL